MSVATANAVLPPVVRRSGYRQPARPRRERPMEPLQIYGTLAPLPPAIPLAERGLRLDETVH